MFSPGRLEHMEWRRQVLLRGEPVISVKGKVNPDWIDWYRATNRVSGNIALNAGKKLIREAKALKQEPLIPEPPKTFRKINPHHQLLLYFQTE
jgi:hypothetical protein